MEKKVNSARNSFIARLSFFVLLSVVFVFTACKDGDEHTGGDGDKEFKLNCVILTKAQAQVWVDSGWTKDSTTSIKKLLLQPYSSNTDQINSNMTLVAYPGQTIDNVKVGGKTILAADTSCKGLVVSGPIVFSDNTVSLLRLNIFKPDGTLQDFDFVRFIPEKFARNPEYISYKFEVVRGGKPDEGTGDGTNPCPPYCPGEN